MPGAPIDEPEVGTPARSSRSRASVQAVAFTSSHSILTGRRLPPVSVVNGAG